MALDRFKREFIQIIEEPLMQLRYPKNYFSCLMAVFIEQKPITQGRIMELTGCTVSTVSQMLKLLLINNQIVKIKKPKIRKGFYTINHSLQKFMLNFFRSVTESYRNRIDFIQPLIEELKPFVSKHEKFNNFQKFLKNIIETTDTFWNLHSETEENLVDLILKGQLDKVSLKEYNQGDTLEYMKRLQDFMQLPQTLSELTRDPIRSDKLLKEYNHIKSKFYQEYQASLNASQFVTARNVIGTELILENRPLTQAEIEYTTKYSRSQISDVLSLLVNQKMVHVIKKPSDSKKYYRIQQSWEVRTLNRFRLNINYAITTEKKLDDLIQKIRKEKQIQNAESMKSFLADVLQTFVQYGKYNKLLEIKYLNSKVK